MAQIEWPTGLVHLVERKLGHPGHDLPTWAAVQMHDVEVFPMEQVKRGHVYVTEAEAVKLRVGAPIQIDRYHATIAAVGAAETVTTPDGAVRACAVRLRDVRWV